MKRKCYALLSLLLAVCMVLPMGVFVGAADTKEPTWTVKVSGAIDENGKTKDEYEIENGDAINVAVDGTVTIKAAITDGYSITSASANDKGAFSLDKTNISSGVVSATGIKAGASDTITITAADANKNTRTFSVTVNVAKSEILGVRLTVNGQAVENKGSLSFKPGDVVEEKNIAVEARFSDQANQENWTPVSNAQVSISMENDISASRSSENGKITVRGGDNRLTCVVSIPGYSDETVRCNVNVSGTAIKKLKVEGAPKTTNNFGENSPISLSTVADNTTVTVEYSDGSKLVLTNGYESHWYEIAHPNDTVSGTINAKDADKYMFYVTYGGETSNEINVSEAIKVEPRKITKVEMDVSGAVTKNYFETQTLDDFRGVVVTVTYDDGSTQEITDDVEIGKLNLYIEPFSSERKWISIQYGNLKPETVDVSMFTISKKTVERIEAITTGVTLTYDVGDKLNLNGLSIKVIYNVGEPEVKKYTDTGITCYPSNGSTITADTKTVTIYYKVGDVSYPAEIKLTLKNTKKLTNVDVISSPEDKIYFVGEKFQPKNYRIRLYYNNEVSNSESLYLDSSKLTVSYVLEDGTTTTTAPTFSSVNSGNITLKIKRANVAGEAELNLTVTVKKRPNLKSITAVCTKENDNSKNTNYFVGDVPSVKDFVITVQYDDGSTRIFTVDKEDSKFNARTPYSYSRSDEGVTYTVKLSPSTIDEDTRKITVSYGERVTIGTTSNKTVDTDVDVTVTVPDCVLKHYISFRNYETTAYESIHDALDNVKEGDEIELYRDVTLTGDEPQSKSFEIDLNGHTLTMIRGEIYVRSNASSSTKITFSNSSRDDAHIRYTANEDDDIIIAYNKEYVIDRFSKNDGRYDITITSVKNGKVTGPTEVIHGHDAKFTITPDEGYEIAAIKVNNKTYKAASDNTLLIEDVREKLTVTVTFQEKAWQNPFTDVSKYATYYKAVQFVYEEGLFNGTSATKFEPDTTMTRAMFVTVLGRLAGVNVNNYKTSSFSDVATGQWYSEYVEWASSIGLVEGYGNGKFGPNDSITHAQMYVLMERYADIIEGKNTTASGTSISANDVRDIPDWAYEAVEYAAKNDFLVVSSYKLTPNDNAKRSELAMLLQKFCKNILGY